MATDTKDRHLESVADDEAGTGAEDAEEALAREADAQGKSIEELAAEREANGELDNEEPAKVAPMQIPLPGTVERISASAGGKAPTGSEMRLLGGRQPIEGQFAKGDTVLLLVEVQIGSVEFVDAMDEWGTVERTTRRHKGRIISCRRADKRDSA